MRGRVDGLQYSSTTLPIDGLMSWERCKVEHHVQKALHGRKLSRAPTSIRRGPNVRRHGHRERELDLHRGRHAGEPFFLFIN